METITHPTLVQLVAAGAVRVVVAVGQPGGWSLLVCTVWPPSATNN